MFEWPVPSIFPLYLISNKTYKKIGKIVILSLLACWWKWLLGVLNSSKMGPHLCRIWFKRPHFSHCKPQSPQRKIPFLKALNVYLNTSWKPIFAFFWVTFNLPGKVWPGKGGWTERTCAVRILSLNASSMPICLDIIHILSRRHSPSLRDPRKRIHLPNGRSLHQCYMQQYQMSTWGATKGSCNGVTAFDR